MTDIPLLGADTGQTKIRKALDAADLSIVDRSKPYRSPAMHPSVMAGGDHIFVKASSWMLAAVELIEIYPGQPDQMLYLDLPVGVEDNRRWTLDDFTEENGATRSIPGSRLWSNKERATRSCSSARRSSCPTGLAISCDSSATRNKPTRWATSATAQTRCPQCTRTATSAAAGPSTTRPDTR